MAKDEDNYWGDVLYRVWMQGGNPDLVDQERTDEYYHEGLDDDEGARLEIRKQRRTLCQMT